MDLIEIIEGEHRQMERLFERFERTARGHDERRRAEAGREVVRALSTHAAVEEQVLYPALQRTGLSAERLDALEDHHAVKVALSELRALSPTHERYAAKMHLVEKTTRLHVEEEERQLLPALREGLAPEELQRLGDEFEALRSSAPTRPHPGSPDTPPVNYVTNAAAALLDRLLDGIETGRALMLDTARKLVASVARAGREAADRTRRDGTEFVEQARATGVRALERTRVLSAAVVEGAAETGKDVAERIEQRSASAARQLGRSRAAVAPRARRREKPARARGSARRHG